MLAVYLYSRKKRNERKKQQAEAQAAAQAEAGLTTNPDTQGEVQDGSTKGVTAAVAPAPPAGEKTKKEKKVLTAEEKAEKKRLTKYRWKICIGLVAPFMLQALDTTIIASALPFIAADFGEVKQLNWIISAFNLTSAAFLPFWAQIADIFGRHATLQSTVLIMLVGSAICTGAPTSAFGVLLLGRALQGVGAAGVNISVRTVLADRVSLSDYALNWTIFALVSAGAFSVGPVVGGYLTQASWRWCFAINLPVGVVAIFMVWFLLRKDLLGPQPLPELEGRAEIGSRRGRFVARLGTIDYGGQMLFLWGLGLLILAFTWAGGTYGWSTAAVLAPLVIGGVLAVGWIGYEYLMAPGRVLARVFPFQRAMMPWELISQRDIGVLFIVSFCTGMAMFAVLYFMDLYFALVQGNTASKAGIALLYFLPGLGVGAYMAMFGSNIWPRQTLPSILLGGVTTAVGITVLPFAVRSGNTNVVYGMMALTGHGIGMRMNPASLHSLAYFPKLTAAVTCLQSFAMPFGGCLGLTLMATVFNNKVHGLTTKETAANGIEWAFIAIIPFMWVCVLLSTLLGNVWILKEGGHEVVDGAYLWSFLRRDKLERRLMARGDEVIRGDKIGLEEKAEEEEEPKAVHNGEDNV